jgi:hypothetical protein
MSPLRSHLNRPISRWHRPALGAGLLALASLVGLAIAGCNGEEAFRARDASAWSGLGGGGLVPDTGGTVGTGNGGSTGVGGMAGAGAGVGTGGGVGGAGNGGSVGTGGAGGRATGPGASGTTCSKGADCMTGFCFDGTCCQSDCSGACRSCNNSTGTCNLAASGDDPRSDCPMQAQSTCGNNGGKCNGSGACIVWPANTVCESTAACDPTSSSVIPNHICNGGGKCVPNALTSCHGFLCTAGACMTTCTDDTACVPGGFCSGKTCIGVPNLAGNGDLESGTNTGWSSANGSGSLAVSSPTSSGYAHGGQYAIMQTGRSANYVGPGYYIPSGLGKYVVSAWGLQVQDPGTPSPVNGVLQIRLQCASGGNGNYITVQDGGLFGMSLPEGVWTMFSATVDTSTNAQTAADCFANGATPGLVRSAVVYLNQNSTDASTPVVYPDLYLDDLVIQVTDGHNLIGNPNFEAGFVDGWNVNGSGTSTLGLSTTVAHGGTHSLWQKARTLTTSGIKYALPIGAARYLISFQVLQSGTMQHVLALQPAYSCIGSATVYTPTNSMVTAPATANTWTSLGGTFVFPPLDAPAGCQLSTAAVYVQQAESGTCGTIECPDLYLDDASITLK